MYRTFYATQEPGGLAYMKGHHPRKQLQNLGEIHSWETLSVLYINCLAPMFKRVEIRNLSQLKAELKLRTCLI